MKKYSQKKVNKEENIKVCKHFDDEKQLKEGEKVLLCAI
jgi:hypothetical protein